MESVSGAVMARVQRTAVCTAHLSVLCRAVRYSGDSGPLGHQKKKKPLFTTALIAGDCVILDAIAKAGLLDKIQVVFVDTFFLFPESMDFLHEVRGQRGERRSGHSHSRSRSLDGNGTWRPCEGAPKNVFVCVVEVPR